MSSESSEGRPKANYMRDRPDLDKKIGSLVAEIAWEQGWVEDDTRRRDTLLDKLTGPNRNDLEEKEENALLSSVGRYTRHIYAIEAKIIELRRQMLNLLEKP